MDYKEVLNNLCYYDIRNPEGFISNMYEGEEIPKPGKICYCDNCFYGRTKLAEYIVDLKNNN